MAGGRARSGSVANVTGVPALLSWRDVGRGAPEIARLGMARLDSAHLALLGTLRRDGSPRISPGFVAESFGADAERYDRARPSYPGALVDQIIAVSPGRDVLDVGCGTGIAARQFQAAGCRVLGVDPDARMADLARRHGLEAEVAKFEDWDPAGRQWDAVVAGQAWHGVDPVAGAARAAQALRPAGRTAGDTGGHRRRHRRGGGQLHDALHHRGGHRAANRRPLTGLTRPGQAARGCAGSWSCPCSRRWWCRPGSGPGSSPTGGSRPGGGRNRAARSPWCWFFRRRPCA
jgi:SAM-dependent methyltransferase